MSTAVQVNAGGVFALFEHAIAKKLKWPKISLQTDSKRPVELKRAGDRSKYTGQIMVTDGRPYGANTYYGRIDLDGVYHPTFNPTLLTLEGRAAAEVETLLSRLSSDPAKVASEYGRLTGNCCFCSRRLDDQRSTAVGYGPICAEKFGLPWGE